MRTCFEPTVGGSTSVCPDFASNPSAAKSLRLSPRSPDNGPSAAIGIPTAEVDESAVRERVTEMPMTVLLMGGELRRYEPAGSCPLATSPSSTTDQRAD